MNPAIEARMSAHRQAVEATLDRLLPPESGPASTLARAMRYAVFGGGKRLRPILAILSCEACGGTADVVLAPAAALEMIHTYSLIHDDLPAMDDDDLRRGRPTLHREYDEAAAILAGDGLLTLAFEVLARHPDGADRAIQRAEAVAVVARRAGALGMVGGQIADIEAERAAAGADRLEWIHRHKTGELLSASAELGAIHAGADPERRRALAEYGAALGLAFQIADDILDETSTAETLGKTPGKDRRAGKTTYPALFGLEGARRKAGELVDTALRALRPLGLEDPALEALVRYAVTRSH